MKSLLKSDFLPDILGSTLTIALVVFAFLVLFGKSATAFELEPLKLNRTEEAKALVAKELLTAQTNASEELVSLQRELRLQLEKRLASDIDLDFDLIPETPMVSDAGASRQIPDSASDL